MALVANGKPRKAAMTSCEACFSVADKERVGHITLEQFLAFARSNLDVRSRALFSRSSLFTLVVILCGVLCC